MALQLSHIGIIVKNMKTSLDFYRLLGMDIPASADTEGHVEYKVGGLSIAWDSVEVIKSFDPNWTPASGGHRIGLDFLCASPAEVDSTYAALIAKGYENHKPPFDAFWGQRYATVHDPDGNGISLFAAL